MTRFETDIQYLIDTTKKLVECDSPVGYYERIHELLHKLVAETGYELQIDNKATAYVLVEGKDTSKTMGVNAHYWFDCPRVQFRRHVACSSTGWYQLPQH